ncbi:META domain-containing protein [Marinoscillum sp. MHG1-6]|uniref:META domain-containing protein n=1 Tax=Marinoscillum sp. MHG1-6 TaxID=2959627 RepID=UPI0021585CE0|nr:META domain-containing protein [Marinoscillum sp. MHG1-6]
MKINLTSFICTCIIVLMVLDGCKNTKKQEPVSNTPILQPESTTSNIDFVASGKNWSLTIDFDNESTLIFKEDTSVFQTSNFQFNNGKTINLDMGLAIENKGCDVEDFYSVTILKGGKTLKGCGHFTNPAYELLGQWSPESKADGVIDFMSTVKIKGFDGCNQFFGHYQASGDLIDFQAISRTKKACPTSEKPNLESLTSDFIAYKIRSDSLWLSNEKSELLLLRAYE